MNSDKSKNSEKTKPQKNSHKLQRNFVSDIDMELLKFDQNHPISSSQQAEISKYQDIELRREQAIKAADEETWQDL